MQSSHELSLRSTASYGCRFCVQALFLIEAHVGVIADCWSRRREAAEDQTCELGVGVQRVIKDLPGLRLSSMARVEG